MSSPIRSRHTQPRHRRFGLARLFGAVALSTLLLGACDVHGPTEAGSLATLTVSPNPATIVAGGTQQFTAIGRDFGGVTLTASPTWTVVSGGGTITSSGLFTASATPGAFANTVKATSGSISGTATVNVTAGPLASLVLTPAPLSLPVGTTQQFVVVGKDAAGNTVALTPTWSVVAGGGAISAAGLFTAGTVAGVFNNTVKVSSGGISATATVTTTAGTATTLLVAPSPATLTVGGTQQFTATATDANGNAVTITPVWTVVNGGGTISATGLFTAGLIPGTFAGTVRATSGAATGTATVILNAGALATLTVTPNPATLATNGTQQFLVVGRDANGNAVTITPTWSVTAGGGTIVSTTGLFTAGTVAGTYANTVRATVGSIVGQATVIVNSGTLTTITVAPSPATMQVNGTQQFTATGRDAGGNVVVFTPVWTVVNGGGSINGTSGLFTAGAAAGTFVNTVRATSGAISGTATVTTTIGVPVVATIVVTPNPASVPASGVQQFVAVARDAGGNVVAITPVWSVVNGGGAINSGSGLFTAGSVTGTYANTVVATSGAISGAATVTVTAAAPAPIVNLGANLLNGIITGTAVTCITGGTINGNVSIAPGNTITGFGPCVITGVQHLADAVALQGQLDLTTAYNTLAGLPCPPANAIVGNLGGTTKPAGVYCTASGIGVSGTLTLDGGGDPNAVFVFQAGTSLITAGNVVMINSAQAKNVYWQVGSSATLGTASQWQGNILALTSITLVDNATLFGRALARNGAVTLGTNNTITLP